MNQTVVIVDQDHLTRIEAKLEELQRALTDAKVTPRPDWLTISDYAETMGRSQDTVRRWIRMGRIETKRVGNVTMVRRP